MLRVKTMSFMLEFFPRICTGAFNFYRDIKILKLSKTLSEKSKSEIKFERKIDTVLNQHSKLLIVVPSSEFESSNWGFGQGNYWFEIHASYSEYLGYDVELFVFDVNAMVYDEFERLRESLIANNFSHMLASLESNPGSNSWDWDHFAIGIAKSWSGLVIGLSTDSVYRRHQVNFCRFIKFYRKTVVIGIDVFPDFKYLDKNHYFGPTLLPISRGSIARIDNELQKFADTGQPFDTVFAGAVYEYRKKLLTDIAGFGLKVEVNPHKILDVQSHDFSYASYIQSLKTGKLALNLSRANGVDTRQLKSRVLEAPVFGIPILSDENILISKFFIQETEYLFFELSKSSISDINKALMNWVLLSSISHSAQVKARKIAQSAFWNTVAEACQRQSAHV